ncbi:hypothetical protein ACFOJ6_12845 [Gordonia humi]|uniref:hypothetical protein n=1 Tax=Gordonia humi TaxID=686429 RepID=UPI00360A5493
MKLEFTSKLRAQKPDPSDRPSLVVWALRLWMISGAVLAALGILWIVDHSVNVGLEFGPLAIGVLIIIVGVAYFLLGAKTYRGELQWRSSLSALTCVVAVMLLALAIGFQSPRTGRGPGRCGDRLRRVGAGLPADLGRLVQLQVERWSRLRPRGHEPEAT